MGLDSNLLNGINRMEYCGEINTLKKLMPWRLGISPSLGFTFISRPTSFILLASSTMATSILESSKLNYLTTFINTYTSFLSQKNINMPKSRPLSLQVRFQHPISSFFFSYIAWYGYSNFFSIKRGNYIDNQIEWHARYYKKIEH